MTAAGQSSRDQARLWLAAFVISAALNGVILLGVGLNLLASLEFVPRPLSPEEIAQNAKRGETIALIVPEIVAASSSAEVESTPPEEARPDRPSFARTTRDQESEAPEQPAFIGERNTRATSEMAPEADAPLLPNQEGAEPADEGDMETTVSRYQDGDLATDRIARPNAPDAASDMAVGPDSPEPMKEETAKSAVSPPPPTAPREKLVDGQFPVEREVRSTESPQAKPSPEMPPSEEVAEKISEEAKELPKEPEDKREMAEKDQTGKDTPPTRPAAAAPDQPGFRGYQYKHRIRGSITRQGRSALDVEDSVIGRYHAVLSRAVEQEWQRNCVRNRDYITPGQIIVRFVLESSGKVRSVVFVEEFGVGNIQKGFTSESIRSARIPPFPAELKKELGSDPLEVTYSFTF